MDASDSPCSQGTLTEAVELTLELWRTEAHMMTPALEDHNRVIEAYPAAAVEALLEQWSLKAHPLYQQF
jgi:hypothetical protein